MMPSMLWARESACQAARSAHADARGRACRRQAAKAYCAPGAIAEAAGASRSRAKDGAKTIHHNYICNYIFMYMVIIFDSIGIGHRPILRFGQGD